MGERIESNRPITRASAHEIELCDRVIQQLFGIGLKLEYCAELVDESPEQAKAGLEASVEGLGALISSLRDRIGELHGADRTDERMAR